MMNITRKLLLLVSLVAVFAVFALPAFAQNRTVTVTEDQINSSYRVTNSARRSVSNLHVDLQSGQAVITATVTVRGGNSWNTVTTLTPSVSSSGRVTWTVASVTVDGQAASQDVVNQINNSIASSWRSFIRNQYGTGRVASVSISDSAITFTLR
ncbi:MAG: hypothetical protein U0694_21985 [Anaerolineae bacterium]